MLGGSRVSKADPRLECYGALDELNSQIGRLTAILERDPVRMTTVLKTMAQIQRDLFVVGSHLACEKKEMRAKLSHLEIAHIQELEKTMDQMSGELSPLKNFVLPGGHESAAEAHLCRTGCRRAERLCVGLEQSLQEDSPVAPEFVIYLNRLSDYFFVLARYLNHLYGITEPIWKP